MTRRNPHVEFVAILCFLAFAGLITISAINHCAGPEQEPGEIIEP